MIMTIMFLFCYPILVSSPYVSQPSVIHLLSSSMHMMLIISIFIDIVIVVIFIVITILMFVLTIILTIEDEWG
eukprot:m.295607 g.295607  ORF g.295607 m.295607 type:complete len:73 (+) comp250670_c0_seq1:28-246(+)